MSLSVYLRIPGTMWPLGQPTPFQSFGVAGPTTLRISVNWSPNLDGE